MSYTKKSEPCRPDRTPALSVSEARYKTMVETMGDGLSEIDEHQNTTYANDTLCRMWGRTRDEIIGVPVTRFVDEENRAILMAQLEKRRRGESHAYEIVWTRKDGSRLHTLMTPTPYFDETGRFKGSFATARPPRKLRPFCHCPIKPLNFTANGSEKNWGLPAGQ